MRLSFVFGRRPVVSCQRQLAVPVASCQFICQLPWHSFNKFVLAKRLHEPAVFNRNHILGLGPSNLQPSLALTHTHTHRRTRSVDTVKEFQFQFEFLTTISVAVVELGWAGLGLYGGFSYCHSPSPSLSLGLCLFLPRVLFLFSQFWARHGIRVRNIV